MRVLQRRRSGPLLALSLTNPIPNPIPNPYSSSIFVTVSSRTQGVLHCCYGGSFFSRFLWRPQVLLPLDRNIVLFSVIFIGRYVQLWSLDRKMCRFPAFFIGHYVLLWPLNRKSVLFQPVSLDIFLLSLKRLFIVGIIFCSFLSAATSPSLSQ